MAQPSQPFQHYLYPTKGWMIPGVVLSAGTFTTDANGNVTSVSGLAPGLTVSGTSLSSGIYTVFFGDGPNINQVGNGTIGQGSSNTLAGGSPTVVDSFNRVLFLTGSTIYDTGLPSSEMVVPTQKDSVLGQGKLQYLKSTVTTPIASGAYVATPYLPALAASKTFQVFTVLWVHKDAS